MENLKNETLYKLHANGKKKSDVKWVGCEEFCIPVEDFWKLADREYDGGFGAAEVATDLLVVGDGWWLERHEYDGSEWWEYKECPRMPEEERKVERVMSGMWDTLKEINS